MKRILIINTIGLGYEGITSVIYNYINSMNRDELEFHFLAFYNTNSQIVEQFKELGVVHVISERNSDAITYIKELCIILKKGFDIIHIHGNSGTMLVECVIAKIFKVKKIIIHCHNTTCNHKIMNFIFKLPMKIMATNLMACSKMSGNWLYGKSAYTVLNNAIDVEKYRFNINDRKEIRREYGIDNQFVIGHSGHFTEQKNHLFLIDVFYEYLKNDKNAKLLLLSDGPRYEDAKAKVKELFMEDSVIFVGRRSDAFRFYNAMDLFVLPSLWEGLPLVMLEAQANGLQVLASDVITKDAKCTPNVIYTGLEQKAGDWARKIHRLRCIELNRQEDMKATFKVAGFDIQTESEKLRRLYLE